MEATKGNNQQLGGCRFWVYGAFQILSGLLQLTKNQSGVVVAGVVYASIDILAQWIGRKAA
jgi:hypothetical protein